MDKIFKAKETYNSVPIPPELETVVKDAIEQGNVRKAKKLSTAKTLAPVAVCAVICLVVGLRIPLSNVEVESDEGVELARMAPQSDVAVSENAAMTEAGVARIENAPVLFDTPYGTVVSERVLEEKKRGNELNLIYCDKNFASFSSVTGNGELKYYNFRENAEDVTLSDLGVSGFSEDARFYICGPNMAVVFEDGREIEVTFGGAK